MTYSAEKGRKTRNNKKKEELENVASCGTGACPINNDEDVIWWKYAISLANLAVLLC